MKRTKQRGDRAGQAKPEHASGCRQFEGEDLSKLQFKHKSSSSSITVTLVQQPDSVLRQGFEYFRWTQENGLVR